jgi:hypothetical protein
VYISLFGGLVISILKTQPTTVFILHLNISVLSYAFH